MQNGELTLTANSFIYGISANVLWIIFAAAVVVFGVLSFVFYYHWTKYEVSSQKAVAFTSLYFLVTAGLLLVMLLSLLAYIA